MHRHIAVMRGHYGENAGTGTEVTCASKVLARNVGAETKVRRTYMSGISEGIMDS